MGDLYPKEYGPELKPEDSRSNEADEFKRMFLDMYGRTRPQDTPMGVEDSQGPHRPTAPLLSHYF
jgi:hypothetical protein